MRDYILEFPPRKYDPILYTMKTKPKAKKTAKKAATKHAAKKKPNTRGAHTERFAVRKADSRPLEKDIEKRVCDYARQTYNFYVRKFTSPGQTSVPDRLLISPFGVHFFIEFKRAAKTQDNSMGVMPEPPTVKQQAEHDAIRACGGKVYIVCDVAEGKKLIDDICFGL